MKDTSSNVFHIQTGVITKNFLICTALYIMSSIKISILLGNTRPDKSSNQQICVYNAVQMYHIELIKSIFIQPFLHIATINDQKICAYSQFFITLFLEIIKCPSNFVKQPPSITTINPIFFKHHDPPWINFQIVFLRMPF
jgi:hypothetical protein